MEFFSEHYPKTYMFFTKSAILIAPALRESKPMNTTTLALASCGHKLDMAPESFGELTPSGDLLDNVPALRERLERDGYLYIPGFFERDEILEARTSLTDRLAAEGLLNPAYPSIQARWNPERRTEFKPELANDNPALDQVVFGSQLDGFYEALFGEKVLHFDFKWIRAVGPGKGTNPHCDIVYMCRGTHELLTCWIPYGDVSLELGGLMVLENSHQQSERLRNYLSTDVESYCENRPEQVKRVKEDNYWSHPGWLSTNPASLRAKLGGRWLTTAFRAGDFLTFKMNMVHASLDNQTDCIRLSSDTRYQPASLPVDERWVGANPTGNTRAGKKGRIC
jgi:hypothetical protein